MLEELQDLNEQDRAFVIMSVSLAGKKALDYLKYIPPSRADGLRRPLEKLVQKGKEEKDKIIKAELSSLQGGKRESLFYHADSDWIREFVAGESPAIIAQVLKRLPRSKVGGILRHLSKETRKSLKKIDPTKVSKEIQKLIQDKFESKFPYLSQGALEGDEVLKKLSEVKLKDFENLLHELGISEMAVAFSKINRSAVRAILNRLRTEDAKELRKRIKQGNPLTLAEQREAQLHILSLDLEKLDPNEIIQEIGLGVLSKAFGKGDKEMATYFVYKLPPRLGYLFKRYVDQNLRDNPEEKVLSRREQILDAYTRLKEGA